MLLGTYQPLEPSKTYRNKLYDCFRPKLDGEYPVFCFPARTADEFCFRSLLASPCKPEKLVLFKTGDFARFDAVEWNKIMTMQDEPNDQEFKKRFSAMFSNVDERFSEYVVKPSALENAIGEIEIYDLIMNETFDDMKAEHGRELIMGLQKLAKNQYVESMRTCKIEPSDKHDYPAMIALNAFLFYLGSVIYRFVIDGSSTIVDAVPFLCDSENASSVDAYNTFQELRFKIFDTTEGGSHQDYLEMSCALEDAISKSKLSHLSKWTTRNGFCPCNSGKKFKKCHGAKPVDIFPF